MTVSVRSALCGGFKRVLLGTTAAGGLVFAIGLAGPAQAETAAPSATDSATATADAALDYEVSGVVVTGQSAVGAAQSELRLIPGGVSVIDASDVEKGRVQSNADLLKLTPGVIASATGAGGLTAVKVSVRGSGVNNGVGYFRQGIKYTFDDLPVTTPGGVPYELFDPSGLSHTEVLRSENAFTTGALALGGTVNFVSKTGRTAPYTELRTEIGSFGYYKGVAATGGVSGPWDYYFMVSGAHKDGFQDHSNANTRHISASLGYQFNEDIESRFYFHYARDQFAGPGALTGAQIQDDPTQANRGALAANYVRTQPGSYYFGNVTKIRFGDTQSLDLGASWHDYPILIGPGNTASPTLGRYWYGAAALQAKYENSAELFGHRNNLTVAAYAVQNVYGGDKISALFDKGTTPYGTSLTYRGVTTPIAPTTYFGIGNVKKGILYQFDTAGSTDATILFSNDFEVVPDVWLTVGASYVTVPRNLEVHGVSGTDGAISGASLKQRDEFGVPRVGVRWDVNPDLQVYASYGGNVEPKQDWQGVYGPSSNIALYPRWNILYLKPQVSNTAEVGFRGRYGIFQGSAEYFYTRVRNELITLTDPVLQITTTLNAPPSRREGIETSLETLLWQGGQGAWDAGDESRPTLRFTQIYNWSNFHFAGDPVFRHSELPGLPEHYYQGELAFDHPSGFYANLDVRHSSAVWVDYLNTFKADAYTIYGASIGWRQPREDGKGLQLSLAVDNLTDEKYTVAVAPAYNAAGVDVAAQYPGDGRGVFFVAGYKF